MQYRGPKGDIMNAIRNGFLILAFLSSAAGGYASIDLEVPVGAAPPIDESTGYQWGIVVGAGVGVDILQLGPSLLLQLRGDFAYLSWNNAASSYYGATGEYRNYDRLAFFVGARLVFAFVGELGKNEDVVFGLFADGGGEFTIDCEVVKPVGPDQVFDTMAAGGVVGGGLFVHLLLDRSFWFTVTVTGRYHILSADPCFSLTFLNLGLRFLE